MSQQSLRLPADVDACPTPRACLPTSRAARRHPQPRLAPLCFAAVTTLTAAAPLSAAPPLHPPLALRRTHLVADVAAQRKRLERAGVAARRGVHVADVDLHRRVVLGGDEPPGPGAAGGRGMGCWCGVWWRGEGRRAPRFRTATPPPTHHLRGRYSSTFTPSAFCIVRCAAEGRGGVRWGEVGCGEGGRQPAHSKGERRGHYLSAARGGEAAQLRGGRGASF